MSGIGLSTDRQDGAPVAAFGRPVSKAPRLADPDSLPVGAGRFWGDDGVAPKGSVRGGQSLAPPHDGGSVRSAGQTFPGQ